MNFKKICVVFIFVVILLIFAYIGSLNYISSENSKEPNFVDIMPNRSNDVIITTSPGQTDPLDSYNSMRDDP